MAFSEPEGSKVQTRQSAGLEVVMFTRQRQAMSEKFGFRAASTYDAEFLAGCTLLENTSVGTEKLITAARTHAALFWIPNLKTLTPEYPTAMAAESASALASALSAFPYAHTLLRFAKVQREHTIEQQNYSRDVDLKYAATLKQWLATRDEGYRSAKKDMEKKRLLMDAAAWDARAILNNPNDPKKIKAESALREHTDAMTKVQGSVNLIREDHQSHRRALLEFLALQRKLQAKCLEEVETAKRDLGTLSNAFDFKPKAAGGAASPAAPAAPFQFNPPK